jgi:hypothetical protein
MLSYDMDSRSSAFKVLFSLVLCRRHQNRYYPGLKGGVIGAINELYNEVMYKVVT